MTSNLTPEVNGDLLDSTRAVAAQATSRGSRRRLRALGLSPRQLGTNPRALGTNPRAVRTSNRDTGSAGNGHVGGVGDAAAAQLPAPASAAVTVPGIQGAARRPPSDGLGSSGRGDRGQTDRTSTPAAGSGAQPQDSRSDPREGSRSHTTADTSSDGRIRSTVVDGAAPTG
jgi:hypothetical protein